MLLLNFRADVSCHVSSTSMKRSTSRCLIGLHMGGNAYSGIVNTGNSRCFRMTSCSLPSPNNPNRSRRHFGTSRPSFRRAPAYRPLRLIDSLQEMTDRELGDRQTARTMGMPEILEEEDRPEDQYQCTICKAFCYLSQVTCGCKTAVACVEHAHLLCERPTDHLTLRKRFSDEELIETLNLVFARAAIPSSWRAKLGKVLMDSARPPLRSLRALHSEGERINYPLPELGSLRKCVGRANEWVDSANAFLIRKQSRKRSRRSRGRPPLNEPPPPPSDDPGDRPDKGLDELYALLREVETLGFDSPEIGALRTLAQTAEDMKTKAVSLLNSTHQASDRDEFIEECKRVIVDGSSLNVLLDELLEVEKIVDREQLIKELETKVDTTTLRFCLMKCATY